ncbi:uncharacterized protein [Diabrotica undecimpunctata]|uniref:uncharacterized protein isoform X2 n=1 Tax=Diabrotica undecimpunctata TaxID=50387 RepID=UPI003B639FE3
MHVLAIGTILLAMEANAIPLAKSDDDGFKFPITFENGRIGVNFLGFHASAGLGGLLTGNSADGGLHAEAGTPFGQRAWAGLGGDINGAGRSGGGLYAGATALQGLGAVAGLDGNAGPEGYNGRLYSGTSRRGLRIRQRLIGQGLLPPDVQTDVQEENKFPKNQVPDTYIMKVKKTNENKHSSKKNKGKETRIEIVEVDDGKIPKPEPNKGNDKIPEAKNTKENSKLPVYDLDLRSL